LYSTIPKTFPFKTAWSMMTRNKRFLSIKIASKRTLFDVDYSARN
jgi:hypothetical protein